MCRTPLNRLWLLLGLLTLPAAADPCGSAYHSIADIQGDGQHSPYAGQRLTTEGVVHQRAPFGFWIQTPAAQQDDNPATSEGLFIASRRLVKTGQRMRLTGRISERHSITRLTPEHMYVCATEPGVPQATRLTLPLTAAQWEAVEGMRVEGHALVSGFTEQSGIMSGSSLWASAALMWQPTELAPAAAVRGQNNRHQRLLLQAAGRQPLWRSQLPLRLGSRIPFFRGVVDSFTRPGQAIQPRLLATELQLEPQPRPALLDYPPAVSLVVAGFNVNNYFNGVPGPQGNIRFRHSRGAGNPSQLLAQTQRLVRTLVAINADVLVLNEVENDGFGPHSAARQLLAALNREQDKSGIYRLVTPGHKGSDAIQTLLLYRPAVLQPVAAVQVLHQHNSAPDAQGKALFNDYGNRPVLIQTFRHRQQTIQLAALHLKSKGSSCGETARQQNGGGRCNLSRSRAVLALQHFLKHQALAADHRLIVGDFNSYTAEQPLQPLFQAGWLRAAGFSETRSHSYNYRGLLGNLDHIFLSPSLRSKVRGYLSWAINSVENPALAPYAATQEIYRSSDHDPQILLLEL